MLDEVASKTAHKEGGDRLGEKFRRNELKQVENINRILRVF